MKYLAMSLWIFASSLWAFDHSHTTWDQQVKSFINPQGEVFYKRWKNDRSQLDRYTKQLESVKFKEFSSWSVSQQKAFLINAYNSLTIRLILDHYPVKSIKDIGGIFSKPWSKEFFSLLDGKIKSLDPIEHEWLRKMPKYKDPRIHAAVNCASISCPVLRNEAFIADRLDAQLTDATKKWLADQSRNQYDVKAQKVKISKIFDWFDEDFGGNDAGIANFLRKYGPQTAKNALKNQVDIDYLKYDWNLNEAGKGA